LCAGIKTLGLALEDSKVEQLLDYITEFAKWNRAYNLSAVRNIDDMIVRHLLDSLAVVPHVAGQRIIDVGTGGGLPGIPLAICYPERQFTLLDSNGKKTRFIFHVKTLLGLHNVTVENGRVEALEPTQLFDGVISRAFASLADMTGWCQHLLAAGGKFYAMKGQFPKGELAEIADRYQLVERIDLRVPGEAGERHLLILDRAV
jgi:16S rRNA (guanine527-N7)-methyltransferase